MGETAIDTSDEAKRTEAAKQRAFERTVLAAASGGGITMAGKLFKVASRFVIAVLLARLLGAEQFGLYNISLTAVEIAAGLAALGMGTAVIRYIPVFASRRDEASLWGAIQVNIGVPVIVSLALATGLYILAKPIAEDLLHQPQSEPLLRLASLAIPFFTLSDMAAAATRGFRRMEYTVIAQQIAQPLIRLSLYLGLAVVGLNALRALAVSSLAEVVVALMLLYFLNKHFPLWRPLRAGRRDFKEMLRFSLPVYLSSLINTYGRHINVLLLGAFSSIKNVGIFVLANQVNLITDMFQGSLVTVSMPIISDLYTRGEHEQLGRYYKLMTKWSVTLNLPLFLFLMLFAEPVIAIFGSSFAGGEVVLAILVWAGLVDAGTGICGAMLDMTGNTMLKLINSIMTFVLSIGLGLLFIPSLGLIGAAIATLAAQIIINLLRLLEVFILFRMLPYSLSFLKPITAGLAAMLITLVAIRVLPPQASYSYVIIDAALLMAVYVAGIVVLGLSAEDRAVLGRLRRRTSAALQRSGRHGH